MPSQAIPSEPGRLSPGMADIAVTPRAQRTYEVVVDGASRHRVTVPERFGDDDLERVVRASFEFLLEREPASSILAEFSLDVIGRYFPEYEDELPRRLA
jgi:acetylornithine deacetylase/succinyl-diaminopimelate desuccinylase-like protein